MHKFPKRKFHWRKPNSLLVERLYRHGIDEYDDEPIPCTKLRGMWMQQCGVKIGERMDVEIGPGYITLRVQEKEKPDRTHVRIKKKIRVPVGEPEGGESEEG
jgi:toxic protein SymE